MARSGGLRQHRLLLPVWRSAGASLGIQAQVGRQGKYTLKPIAQRNHADQPPISQTRSRAENTKMENLGEELTLELWRSEKQLHQIHASFLTFCWEGMNEWMNSLSPEVSLQPNWNKGVTIVMYNLVVPRDSSLGHMAGDVVRDDRANHCSPGHGLQSELEQRGNASLIYSDGLRSDWWPKDQIKLLTISSLSQTSNTEDRLRRWGDGGGDSEPLGMEIVEKWRRSRSNAEAHVELLRKMRGPFTNFGIIWLTGRDPWNFRLEIGRFKIQSCSPPRLIDFSCNQKAN